MSKNYNNPANSNNNKNGKAFTGSPDFLQKHNALTNGKDMDKQTDVLKLKLIYETLPDHCVQFLFLS